MICKLADDVFVESQLRVHISLIGHGVFVVLRGISPAIDVVVIVGGTPGAGRGVHDDYVVGAFLKTSWDVGVSVDVIVDELLRLLLFLLLVD